MEVLEVEFGHPADIICRVAETGGFDLIVMGEKGAGEIGRFLLGSVADRVSRHATCPVMIVRRKRGVFAASPPHLGIDA